MSASGLKPKLVREITLGGPMTVADFVVRCLHHPVDGYYSTRPALGEKGDFITAPLISQMFGEMLGLWIVETWTRLGQPSRFRLVEVGPGDATLILDAWRAIKGAAGLVPGLEQACELLLIEPSEPLQRLQAERLAPHGLTPRWVGSLDDIGTDAPVILIANEVLDCMPARQFVRTHEGWAERCIGVTDEGELVFGLVNADIDLSTVNTELEVGQILEVADQQCAFSRDIARLICEAKGVALLIDYGRDQSGAGDTLQALKNHTKIDPLACPGQADLTQWADFPSLLKAAAHQGAAITRCLGQGEFLMSLGIGSRAERLISAHPERALIIKRQLNRLIAPDQMGTLFKVAAIYSPETLPIPGFEQ